MQTDPMNDPLRKLHLMKMSGSREVVTTDKDLLQHAELMKKRGLVVRRPRAGEK